MNRKFNDSRRRILEKSKVVFMRKGFSNVTMKDIVEECNISRGGLYHHFSSVDEIFSNIIEQEKNTDTPKDANDYVNAFFDKLKIKLENTDIKLLRAVIEFELTEKM